MVCKNKTKLYIQVDALSWLVNYVKAEMDSGGVSPVIGEDLGEAAELGKVYWDFRDNAWVARVRSAEGVVVRARRNVLNRTKVGRDLAHLSFEDAKQTVYAELVAFAAGENHEALDGEDSEEE